ncbi:hypothetical protein [Phenylobacterium sp.]|uniref:hypothetical protein n=1 Tax=Phenylobacterium sp. TaxID=1871053 RepID=UPI002FDF0AA8
MKAAPIRLSSATPNRPAITAASAAWAGVILAPVCSACRAFTRSMAAWRPRPQACSTMATAASKSIIGSASRTPLRMVSGARPAARPSRYCCATICA